MDEQLKTNATIEDVKQKIKPKMYPSWKDFVSLRDEVQKLSLHLQNLQPFASEPPRQENHVDVPPTGDGKIEQAVKRILGDGNVNACQFGVRIEKAQEGISFRLVIVPPSHLKESDEDIRVKIINFMEAIPQSERFAETVRRFCIAWAAKNGVTYQA